jgi:hypothetical protein
VARSASAPDPRRARHIKAHTGLVAVVVGAGLASGALPAGHLPVLVGTSEAAPPCEAPLGFGAPRRLESSDVVVLFRTVPSPIEIGQHFTVEALVCPTPPIGAAAGFMVDARMPEHRHGMNYRARVFRKPDGIYVAEGLLFHMPGLWQLMFDVERGGRMERLTMDIDLE